MTHLLPKLVLALLVCFIVAGCGGGEEEATPPPPPGEGGAAAVPAEPTAPAPTSGPIRVTVGVVIPLTGEVATYGDEADKGIRLATEEALAAGIVIPEVITVDNAGEQLKSTATVRKFIDSDNVSAIIGAITSNNSKAAGELAEAAKVPMVTPASTHVDITKDKEYVFRVCFTDHFQGAAAADFIYDSLGRRRVAVLVNSSQAYSMGLGDAFCAAFMRRGGEIVSRKAFSSDTDDFGGHITPLRLKAPEVIFMPAYYEKVAKCISQARTQGLRSTFVGTDGWDSPKLYTLSAGAVKGNYFTNHFAPDEDRQAVRNFVQSYKDKYGEPPGAIAALSYDAAAVVFDAVARAGSPDREAIRQALEKTEKFEGVTGNFSIDEGHNAIKSLVILETGANGATLKEVINP